MVRARGIALVLLWLAACGGGADRASPAPPASNAKYQVFQVAILSPAPGGVLRPGQQLSYEINYQGDLANPPDVTAVIVAPGGTRTVRRLAPLASTQQDSIFRTKSGWFVRDEALKRPGRFELFIEVSIRATRTGSQAWVARSPSVFLDLQTAIDDVRITAPAADQPVTYGTPLAIEVVGRDLWDTVQVAVIDQGGNVISDQPATIPFADGDTRRNLTWTVRARPIERVGSHPVRLVASFGDVHFTSPPVTLALTHTIDEVVVLLRDASGGLGPAVIRETPLPAVRELVARARGTQLAGHTFTVNGGQPILAAADQVEVIQVPRSADFAAGKGVREYAFTFLSGGVERTAKVSLRRWGITDCGWFAADGRRYANLEEVKQGTPARMHATTWGFPDTRTTFGIFKDRVATFTIKEDDGGRHILLAPGADEVDDFDADIRANATDHVWITRFDEDTPLPLDGWPLVPRTNAELFFDVQIEEETCRSSIIRVPSGGPKM